MSTNKINDRRLLRLIDGGKSQAEAARIIGVSRQAVSQRLQELRGKTTKAVIVAKKIEQITDCKIDAMAQLTKINSDANEILELLMRWNRGDDEALQILESQVKKVKVGKGKDAEWVKEYKFKDPRELALKAMNEIRGQLKLQLDIFQALFDMRAVEEFQSEVLEAIGQASPEIRDAIVRNLNQKQAIRSVVKFR
ncbi:MAG: AsnC family protein [Deltaproteobacteria bacterium]|nr:AsnC family protein [Deltaproteobacteria bacterium]